MLYPASLTPGIQVLLGTLVVAVNALIYALVVQRPADGARRTEPERHPAVDELTRPRSPPARRGRGDGDT